MIRKVEEPDYVTDDITDERLRLIFTCCHPALSQEAQVALTLHTLCGRPRARSELPRFAHGIARRESQREHRDLQREPDSLSF
jgi:hypothetical protein